jgi:hypothetical protein
MLTITFALTAAAADGPIVQVRATRETAPCVTAAVAASPQWRATARVEVAPPREPGAWDVVVASDIELTRALESGAAEVNTDVDLARIPWVFRGAGAARLDASALAGRPIAIPDGPASYEARRALRARGAGVVEAAQVRELHEAPLALVPLSLAGEGPALKADGVPSLVARAALATGVKRPAQARALVEYLASDAGQRAFAACGRPLKE